MVELSNQNFVCEFCDTHLKTEDGFLIHKCNQMKKFEELNSIIGQRALIFYNTWFSAHGKRRELSGYTFIKSRYFRAFIKFSEFVQKSRFRHPDKFIDWAVKNNFPPAMWLLPDTYGAWSAFSLKNTSPIELVEDSIDVLSDIAEDAKIDLSEVFDVMTPSEIVHLVCYQQLSPWALLNSSKFKQFYQYQLKGGDKVRFNAFVDSDRWYLTFQKFPKQHKSIKKLMIDIGL